MGGLAKYSGGDSPMFTALKGAMVQNVLGHPFAYARVLMQVRYSKKNYGYFYRVSLIIEIFS